MRIIKRPTPQTAQMPDTAPQAVQLKESKPVQPNAPQKAKQAVYDSTGQVNYTADFRDAFNFLKQHNPPPIDAAYYAGRTQAEREAILDAAIRAEDMGTIPSSPTEQSYWMQLKADQEELIKQNNGLLFNNLLNAAIATLEDDYIGLLLECLKKLGGTQGTACKHNLYYSWTRSKYMLP